MVRRFRWIGVGVGLVLSVTFCNVDLSRSVGAAVSRQGESGGSTTVEASLRRLLDRQVEAWNRGDVDGFMEGYWNSAETSFSGTSGVTRGWQGLHDRYKRNYPDRAAMGRLTFGKVEVTPLCADAAMILGEWHLEREQKPVGGVFTLVAQKFPEGWRIIHDHTDAVTTGN
jgi:hypothetical protein